MTCLTKAGKNGSWLLVKASPYQHIRARVDLILQEEQICNLRKSLKVGLACSKPIIHLWANCAHTLVRQMRLVEKGCVVTIAASCMGSASLYSSIGLSTPPWMTDAIRWDHLLEELVELFWRLSAVIRISKAFLYCTIGAPAREAPFVLYACTLNTQHCSTANTKYSMADFQTLSS